MSLFNTVTLTVQRRRGAGSGSYVKGKWVEGTLPDPFTITGTWQPVQGEELNNFSEGRRKSGVFRGYTNTKLYTVDVNDPENGRSDLIIMDGENYEVIKVDPYQNGIINHYRFFASLELE